MRPGPAATAIPTPLNCPSAIPTAWLAYLPLAGSFYTSQSWIRRGGAAAIAGVGEEGRVGDGGGAVFSVFGGVAGVAASRHGQRGLQARAWAKEKARISGRCVLRNKHFRNLYIIYVMVITK
jgi:hypothetical protein